MMNEKIAILVDSGTDVPREVIDNGPFFYGTITDHF